MADFSQSTSIPVSVPSPQSDWELQLSQLLSALGQNVYGTAMDMYNKAGGVTDQMINQYLQLASQGQGLAANLLGRYENIFQPLENQYVQEAGTYASTPRIQYNMGAAESATSQAEDQGSKNALQTLQSYGVNPESGRYQDLVQGSKTAAAAAEAGAGQQAELNTENTGRQMLLNSVEMGQQIPGMTVNALNSAYQGVAGAENSALGLAGVGSSLLGTAAPYFNAAMSLRYPPTGQKTQSTSASGGGGGGASKPNSIPGRGGGAVGSNEPDEGVGRRTGGGRPTPNTVPQGVPPGNKDNQDNQDQYGGLPSDAFDQSGAGAAAADAAGAGVLPGLAVSNVFGQDYLNNNQGQQSAPVAGGDQFANLPGAAGAGQLNYTSPAPADWGGVPSGVPQPPNDFNFSTTGPDQGNAVPDNAQPTSGNFDPYGQFDQQPFNDYGNANNFDQSAGQGQYNYQQDLSGLQDQMQQAQQDYSQPQDQSQGQYQPQPQNQSQPQQDQGGGASYGGGGYYARGGGVLPRGNNRTTGGNVPRSASPSRGKQTDDIPARLNAGEFVIPKDVVAYKGHQFFQNLISKSRQARTGMSGPPARPSMKPALPNRRPTFVSQHMGAR